MPNRIIKESIKRSPEIDSLSWFEEVVFYRLLVTADDFGCLDGRAVVLKNELFPTKETVTKKAIEDAISTLVRVGLVRRYTANDAPYLFLPTWELHQRVRNKHRKYPEPTLDSELLTNDGQMTADCLSESNPIRIQSESKSKDAALSQRESDPFKAFTQNEELLAALSEFNEMRTKSRKPMTVKAKQMLLTELVKLSTDIPTQITLLNQAVLHNWHSVYPVKNDFKQAAPAQVHKKTFQEIVAEREQK